MEDVPRRCDRPRGPEICEELQWEQALLEEAMTTMEMTRIANGRAEIVNNTRETQCDVEQLG
jgi:hypothetical protein